MKKVLIIEDYYALADIESLLCTMEGYEVKVAKSGDEGMSAYKSFEPDLVLLDLMLPGEMSGNEVLQKIRDEGAKTKVLVVRALASASNRIVTEGGVEICNLEGVAQPWRTPLSGEDSPSQPPSGPTNGAGGTGWTGGYHLTGGG